jgi:membrane-bound serine protease (ClpP class)
VRWVRRIRVSLVGLLAGACLLLGGASAGAQGGRVAVVLNAKGAITPVLQGYVSRGLARAADSGAELLIVQLDTPGGSVEIMKQLTDEMVRSPIPVIVYVAPEGARAASAGTFVTLAAHVAAMAPGTTIGAASVVGSQGEDLAATEKAKVTNDLLARVRNFTQRRPQAAQDWAQSAVTEAVAATADEALQLGVVDLIATDVNDLLRQLDGFQVIVQGRAVTLHTQGIVSEPMSMTFSENLLHTITDPNIAFILMTIGLNALLFEVTSPGAVVPGVVGGICLLMALYAMGVLSVNYTGILFVVLGFILFVADVKAPTHGVLTVGGVASFVFGSMILFNTPAYSVSRPLIFAVAGTTALFFAFAISQVVRIQRKRPTTGREGQVGMEGVAKTDLAPDGFVLVSGELWKAIVEGEPIRAGSPVRVERIEGLTLRVRPAVGAGLQLDKGRSIT